MARANKRDADTAAKTPALCVESCEHVRPEFFDRTPPHPPPFCMNVKRKGLQNLHFVSC
jgi:hypothetical protein